MDNRDRARLVIDEVISAILDAGFTGFKAKAVSVVAGALDEAEDRTQKAISKMAADWADDREDRAQRDVLAWLSATLREMGPMRSDLKK